MTKWQKERAKNRKMMFKLKPIETRVPSKWVYVDLEEGRAYFHDDAGQMKRAPVIGDYLDLMNAVQNFTASLRPTHKKGRTPR